MKKILFILICFFVFSCNESIEFDTINLTYKKNYEISYLSDSIIIRDTANYVEYDHKGYLKYISNDTIFYIKSSFIKIKQL